MLCETGSRREARKIAMLTDNVFSWPYHAVLSSRPISTSSASRPGLLNRRLGMGHRPQRVRSQCLQAGSHSGLHCLQLSQLEATQLEAAAPSGALSLTPNWFLPWPFTLTKWLYCHGYLHILFHYVHFRLDQVIFFRLFTQVHLLLTARSVCNNLLMKTILE